MSACESRLGDWPHGSRYVTCDVCDKSWEPSMGEFIADVWPVMLPTLLWTIPAHERAA